jgi:hypothetical protein
MEAPAGFATFGTCVIAGAFGIAGVVETGGVDSVGPPGAAEGGGAAGDPALAPGCNGVTPETLTVSTWPGLTLMLASKIFEPRTSTVIP